MAWTVAKNINHTMRSNYVDQPTRHWNDNMGAWYLIGVFLIHTVGTLYKNTDNNNYKIDATIYVQHEYQNIGGYWSGNSGPGIEVSFSGSEIYSSQISTPLSCWSNATHSDVFVHSFSKEFTVNRSGYLDVYIGVWYGGAARIGSPNNVPSSLKPFTSVEGFTGTYSNFIDYEIPDPYKKPSLSLNSVTDIIKVGNSATLNYNYTAGSKSLTEQVAIIKDKSGTYNIANISAGNNKTKAFTPNNSTTSGYTYGSSYGAAMRIKDGTSTITTSYKTFRTYSYPSMDNSLTIQRTEQHANQTNKFTLSNLNNKSHGDSYESAFQTRYRIKRGSDSWSGYTSVGNTSAWSRTAAEMRSLVSKSYDAQTIQIQFERYAPTPQYESSNKPSGSFKVYYRPQIAITGSNASYKNSSGTSIAKSQIIAEDKLTDITVTWTYDTDQAKAGYTQGYRIRLYKNDGTIVKTYYTTSKNYPIPKNDIPKDGLLTYLDITPYFGNDQPNNASSSYANNYWYYNGTITKFNFVIVACRLNTPVITYPVNNNTWINDDFRICFQMPNDPNRSAVSGTYKYDNIEFEINNKVYKMGNTNGTTSGAVAISQNYTFSSLIDNLTYQKKIIIWPNANNLTKNTTYKMRIRVRRPYNATADTYWGWSEWSSYVTITKQVPSYSVSADQYIMASHYNEVRNAVENAKNTYAITATVPDKAVAKNTIIKQEQYYYNNIFKRIVEIKNRVNDYTGETIPASLQQVKFDYTNQIITSFSTSQEYVTAAKNGTNGKNYMQYIFDNVTALK